LSIRIDIAVQICALFKALEIFRYHGENIGGQSQEEQFCPRRPHSL